MASANYPGLMRLLKAQLKAHNLTYAMLAQTLDVSESTLKKWFVAKDGSFNRIVSICEALGIPVHQVLREFEDQGVLMLTFTREQQAAFLADREAFNVYWLLVYERLSSPAAQVRLKLGDAKYHRLLLQLDRLKLIQLNPHDRVKVPRMRPVGWVFAGPFMKPLAKEWVNGIVSDAPGTDSPTRFMLQFFQLTSESEAELQTELKALEEKFARRTIMELSGTTKPRRQIRYLSALAEGSFLAEK